MIDLSRRDFMKAMCLAGVGAGISAQDTWCSDAPKTPFIRHVHVIFKTHLDIGFTALAADVTRDYFERFIPAAIDLARRMRERGGTERFVWTTGSWLIYEYLEQANARQRCEMERAISGGDIRWHALPFTTHTELMDKNMARFALSLSARLDKRFGRRTIAAKMSDVPGHTLSLVPLLDEAGVRLLHIGVNQASRCPSVPHAFRWKTRGGKSVVVLYSTGYGATHIIPGFDHVLSFAHSGDNHGPQTEEQVIKVFHDLSQRFPDASIRGSGMDDFANALPARVVRSLPVVTNEIGDTWIHGVGTDPANVARFREFMRLRSTWLKRSLTTAERESLDKGTRSALMVVEHTWGLDVKTHLGDWDKYTREAFDAARNGEKYRLMESSWQEKGARIESAIEVLGSTRMGTEVRRALERLEPSPLQLDEFEKVRDAGEQFEAGPFRLGVSPATGAIVSLRDPAGREWASPASPLGLATYQSFSQAFYDKYYRYYNPEKQATGGWARQDLKKPGLDKAGAVDQVATARLKGLWRTPSRPDASGFALALDFPDVEPPSWGQPARVEVIYEISHREPVIEVALRWFDKPACRLPEALWFSFQPVFEGVPRCSVSKLGQMVDVQNVVANGNRHLHAVDDGGALMCDETRILRLRSLDAPLIAIGRRMLLKTDDLLPDTRGGLHVNLFNNLWGTNFRMWYGENAGFRFRIEFPGT